MKLTKIVAAALALLCGSAILPKATVGAAGTSNVAGFTVMRSPSLIIVPALLSLDFAGGGRNAYGNISNENTVAPALHNVTIHEI